jgi:alpha-mannosidase
VHPVTGPTVQRAQRFLRQRLRPAVYEVVGAFAVEATAPILEPVPLEVACELPTAPFAIGSPWGPPWHTVWFRLTAAAPAGDTAPLAAVVDLGFHGRSDGFQAEGLAYRDGRVVHAIQPDRRELLVGDAAAGEAIELWVEAAANAVMGEDPTLPYLPTPMGDPATAGDAPLYALRQADLCIVRPEVQRLEVEFHALIDLALDLGDVPQRARLMPLLEAAMAAFDPADPERSATAARAALAPAFAHGAAPGSHRIVATGHAHLDTAWLWPVRETRRKAVRTFANAVDLLGRYPEHRMGHSQAQHYAWVAADQPELFAEVQRLVAEGRWEPVGGMWVETDLNLPSGESLVRQFVHGQRAFTEWFGAPSPGAFLPDDFGYPAQVPQLARLAGCEWFFTQKLSWNDTNRFPHHTFWWRALDGSRVFTHFSPIDTYNALNTPAQFRFAARNFADHAGASTSLVCFGHGDGGGGPTAAMVQRAELAADWEGVPPVTIGTVGGFFAEAIAEYGAAAPVWAGEMYFEYHRGTYTSQARTKQGNLRSERLLYEAELWSVAAGVWPGEELDALWKLVLTQQFHDIIPGSSIAWAHDDAERIHAEVADRAHALIDTALSTLLDPQPNPRPEGARSGRDADAGSGRWVVLNPGAFPAAGVVDAGGDLRWASAPARSITALGESTPPSPVVVDGASMDNGIVRIEWDAQGGLTMLRLASAARDVLAGDRVGNALVLHRDTPAAYDAWDIDRADTQHPQPVGGDVDVEVVQHGPLRAAMVATRRAGASTYRLTTTLDAGAARVDCVLEVDWREREQRLQVVLPVDVHATEALCGTQFGSVRRPRHANTSWDDAKFEVCAHRYVHAGEPGFGVAILAAGPHGFDVRGDALRMTLLKSSRYPDPDADQGPQRIGWSYWLHDGLDPLSAGIEAAAGALVHPLRADPGTGTVEIAPCDAPGVIVEAVKRAEDGSGDLIVRLWESRGARSSGHLRVVGRSAQAVDLLERPLADLPVDDAGVAITLRPHQILTVRVPS